jgi:hypothetical protein
MALEWRGNIVLSLLQVFITYLLLYIHTSLHVTRYLVTLTGQATRQRVSTKMYTE